MNDTETGQLEGLNHYNMAQSENALKIRLETDDTLEKIEMYLRGESYSYDKNGDLIKVSIPEQSKANERGIRSIMSVVTSYVNKSTVQGNLTEQEIAMVMIDYHRGMANLLAFSCEEWNISRNERKSIINFIEPFVFLFISRTKDNKERESYGMSVKETGRETIKTGRGSLNPFK